MAVSVSLDYLGKLCLKKKKKIKLKQAEKALKSEILSNLIVKLNHGHPVRVLERAS